MLIIKWKLKEHIDINDGEFYLQIIDSNKGQVSIKIVEKKENGLYFEKDIIKIRKGTSKEILDGLLISYINGEKSNFKFGFSGNLKVLRRNKVEYKTEKKTDFSFDFDTEGY